MYDKNKVDKNVIDNYKFICDIVSIIISFILILVSVLNDMTGVVNNIGYVLLSFGLSLFYGAMISSVILTFILTPDRIMKIEDKRRGR